MANTFLLANKINIGKSLVEEKFVGDAKKIQINAKKSNCKLIIPIDVVCGKSLDDKKPIEYLHNPIHPAER